MIYDGALIMMDEPKTSIDPKNEKEIFELIESITESKTTIFVIDRLLASKIADEIIVKKMKKSWRKVSHDDLVLEDGIYKNLYELQKSMYI